MPMTVPGGSPHPIRGGESPIAIASDAALAKPDPQVALGVFGKAIALVNGRGHLSPSSVEAPGGAFPARDGCPRGTNDAIQISPRASSKSA